MAPGKLVFVAILLVVAGATPPRALGQLGGDFDRDGDIDLADFLNFQQCFGGADVPIVDPRCLPGDLDGDDDIDLADVLSIQFRFTGPRSGPPPAPSLDPVVTQTRDTSVTLTGVAPAAATVTITGGVEVVTAIPDANREFSALVNLQANRLNRLFVTAIDESGLPGPPTSISITHDARPPVLFIDFPTDGAEITTEATDVTGRVGDMLSGFMGLTVVVNGQPAVVDVGIGTNGTFVASAVPLAVGEPTVITAVATDELGNTITKQTTVTRIEVLPGTPRMVVVAGNGQTGEINSLLPEPIVVRMTRADGSPFDKKIVTFDVTRSNGRLSATEPEPGAEGSLMLQVRTDAEGLARVFWRIGTDAGCGNNRVEATSTSIAGTIALCASGTPAPAAQINIGSGNNQRAEAGAPAPEPLRVWVSDACNGVRDIAVTFRVIRGGGQVNGQAEATVLTGRTGHAEVRFTLGAESGNNLVEANFPSNTTTAAFFTAFGVVRNATQPTRFVGLCSTTRTSPSKGPRARWRSPPARPPSLRSATPQGSFDSTRSSGRGMPTCSSTASPPPRSTAGPSRKGASRLCITNPSSSPMPKTRSPRRCCCRRSTRPTPAPMTARRTSS